MEQITYKLEQYEGPLDLLLTLISKNKIDIADIPISLICDQYMGYIAQAQALDMELAGEFIVMASELMLIKSRMLLPRTEKDEEDPRAGLAEALILYKKAKEAAEKFIPMYAEYSGRMEKDEDEIKVPNELPTGLNPSLLTKALGIVLIRLKELEEANSRNLSPLVRGRVVPVSEKLTEIVSRLKVKSHSFYDIMVTSSSRSALVATFMALLELIREGKVHISGCDEDAGNLDEKIILTLDENYDDDPINTESYD